MIDTITIAGKEYPYAVSMGGYFFYSKAKGVTINSVLNNDQELTVDDVVLLLHSHTKVACLFYKVPFEATLEEIETELYLNTAIAAKVSPDLLVELAAGGAEGEGK